MARNPIPSPHEVRAILAVRNDRFGEFLLNIPVFKALKQRFANATLTVVVDPYVEGLAHLIPSIDEVVCFGSQKHSLAELILLHRMLKKKRFDVALILNPTRDMHMLSFGLGIPVRVGYKRKCPFFLTHTIIDNKALGLKHEIDANLELAALLGVSAQDRAVSLQLDKNRVDAFMNEHNIITQTKPLIAVHPSTSDPVKQWPVERFQALALRIVNELAANVVVVGGQAEAGVMRQSFDNLASGVVNLIGKTSLPDLAGVLSHCAALVSGDSGPVHLASAVGIPVVALFRNDLQGKTAHRWGPASQRSIVLEAPRLSDISVSDVFLKVKELVKP
ncbi:MAG: glycosyltransferase family 9 protein [Candidatus Omnitrophica bacterium]|nr:glycosyltransferase family 9 protein [Candidatus Omnitrophota bacterium]